MFAIAIVIVVVVALGISELVTGELIYQSVSLTRFACSDSFHLYHPANADEVVGIVLSAFKLNDFTTE